MISCLRCVTEKDILYVMSICHDCGFQFVDFFFSSSKRLSCCTVWRFGHSVKITVQVTLIVFTKIIIKIMKTNKIRKKMSLNAKFLIIP